MIIRLLAALLALAPLGALELTLEFTPTGVNWGREARPLPYGGGVLMVRANWPKTGAAKDRLACLAWVDGAQPWAGANCGRGSDGWRQLQAAPPECEGDPGRAMLRLDLGARPAGVPGSMQAGDGSGAPLPACAPLPPGRHDFTFHLRRTGPDGTVAEGSALFTVIVAPPADGRLALTGLADGQVVQRIGAGATLAATAWGLEPGAELTALVTAGTQRLATATARAGADGSAPIAIGPVPTGGPYRVELAAGARRAVLAAVWVGDLWVIGGQSNAVGCGYDATLGAKPVPGVQTLSPRYQRLIWETAADPLFESGMGPWVTAAQGFFAATGVPVGLLGHAVGGKPITYFLDAGQRDLPFLAPLVAQHGRGARWFLWYQGESDAFKEDAVAAYPARLAAAIAAVRRHAGTPGMRVGVVQLGRYRWFKDDHFAGLREAQRAVVAADPLAALLPAIGCEVNDTDKIHLTSPGQALLGRQIGIRLAAIDRAGTVAGTAPEPGAIRFADAARTVVVVAFPRCTGLAGGTAPEEWSVTDATRRGFREGGGFVPVSAVSLRPDAGEVEIRLAQPAGPDAALSYAWRSDLGGSLVDGRGLPVPAFVRLPIR